MRWISEYSGQPRKVTIDAEPLASDFGQDLENGFIGHIISNEYGHSPDEGRMRHQPANALAFVTSGRFTSNIALPCSNSVGSPGNAAWLAATCRRRLSAAREISDSAARENSPCPQPQLRTQCLCFPRGACADRAAEASPKKILHCHASASRRRGRQLSAGARAQKPIQIADRTAAHESERSIHESEQALECLQQPGTNMHFSR